MPKTATATITVTFDVPDITVQAPLPESCCRSSQRTVEAVTGVPPRKYLETIAAPGFPLAVSRLGALRIVDRAAFVAWLKGLAQSAPRAVDDGLDADFLREVGLVRAPPPPPKPPQGRR
jgi:hypothetical protein